MSDEVGNGHPGVAFVVGRREECTERITVPAETTVVYAVWSRYSIRNTPLSYLF